jgi:diguanylate cyclase (GGDEF)-like protein
LLKISKKGSVEMRFMLFLLLAVSLFGAPEKVSLQLLWKNQFQFAGFYIAKEKGFYADAGLDVEIKEHDYSVNVIEDVLAQKSTYGVGRSSLLIQRSKGKPLIVLSAIFQSSPSVLISLEKDILTPKDLRKKRIMISEDEIDSASITSMLLENGLKEGDFTIQKHSYNYKDLIDNKTDAMACYISNEPYFFQKEKLDYKVFYPKDYGYDFYGDLLFTTEQELQEHPQRAKKFNDASIKGWIWAFEHIEESAKIIYEKYNTQNKSLESLIYEGQTLKNLAFFDGIPFGHVCTKRFDEIAKIYKLLGFLDEYELESFVDPLKFNKEKVKIGVLAKRGDATTHKKWDILAEYLDKELHLYNVQIIPLSFEGFEDAVKNKSIDFIITNDMNYVLLEKKYGISRIATYLNADVQSGINLKEYGSVIFTRSDNKSMKNIKDVSGKKIAAVNEDSFGGWIMAQEEMLENGIDKSDFELTYFNTHDDVVRAVLDAKADVGTIRTDVLESMAKAGDFNLSELKIINPKSYENFPYLVSTKLYPEWPFSKLAHTQDKISRELLSKLFSIDLVKNPELLNVGSWGVPSDYAPVHEVLKKLKIAPYDVSDIKFSEVLKEYIFYFYTIAFVFFAIVVRFFYINRVNKHLQIYNDKLNVDVKARTKELEKANAKLKILAQTDVLTGISNRGHFMDLANKYFDIAKRNNSSLQVLSLDLDFFKQINDTYGHQAGDAVLIAFTKSTSQLLRKSDIFGRIGGEEFCIVLQNTSVEGALSFAQRICETIENSFVEFNNEKIKVTVSIGLADLKNEQNILELINKSDKALYLAKESGRNQVYI